MEVFAIDIFMIRLRISSQGQSENFEICFSLKISDSFRILGPVLSTENEAAPKRTSGNAASLDSNRRTHSASKELQVQLHYEMLSYQGLGDCCQDISLCYF